MKKLTLLFCSALFATLFVLTSCNKEEVEEDDMSVFQGDDYYERKGGNGGGGSTGNGGLSGEHYTLNIIGVPQDKTASMTGNNGHRIFVDLNSQGVGDRIYLIKGEEFSVLDANGTDGRAEFQLPANEGETSYTVWMRPLGTPGGSAGITNCATSVETGEEVCEMAVEIVMRDRGRSKFVNVTEELTTFYHDLLDPDDIDGDGIINEADGVLEEYSLFDEALENYAWEYDNTGLKLLQVRFYYNQ